MDSRLEAQLGRPLDELEWRVDLARATKEERQFGEPFLVIPYPPILIAYEPLKTRRLPEDFRVLARKVYPEPSDTWLESDELSTGGDAAKRFAAQQMILGLANKYGFLGDAAVLVDQAGDSITWGEPLSYWTHELGIFRCLMALVDGLQRASAGGELERRELDSQVEKTPSGGRHLRVGHDALYMAVSELVGRSLHFALGDRLRDFVQRHVSVSLAPLAVGRSLRFRPTTLLSAVYLDLAVEMVGGLGARHRDCDYCHQPYRAARRDSRFCSATCRSNARHHKSKGEVTA